jgi:hypothetical protein
VNGRPPPGVTGLLDPLCMRRPFRHRLEAAISQTFLAEVAFERLDRYADMFGRSLIPFAVVCSSPNAMPTGRWPCNSTWESGQ